MTATLAMILCLTVSLAYGQGREREKPGAGRSAGASNPEHKSEGKPVNEQPGREGTGKPQEKDGARSGENPPGGDWSERTHSGKQSSSQLTNSGQPGNASAATAAEKNKTQASGAQGAAAGAAAANNKTPQTSGAQGAAAGAAYANNKTPQATGAQGAAAGAAYANRNSPPVSGAAGAAAGAAAVNRNSPQMSGAQGAALGAAAANQNAPQLSGAQGAALGAAAANNNQPQFSGAQGAAVGAAAVNNNQPQYSGAPGTAVGAAVADNSQPQFSAAQAAPAIPSSTVVNMPVTSGAASAAAGYEAVRNSFNASNVYRPQWWVSHPETWVPVGWIAGAAWHTTPWEQLVSFCGYGDAAPISYDYGVNVTAQNGNVLVDGQNVGSTSDFSQQAANIAQYGNAALASPSDKWMPLGVYAMVRDEHQHPQFIVQLAINPQGILRGNYIDELTESTLPIRGAVDKPTKRAAWTVGSNKQTVMEAGLSDLIDPETPALIHKNGKTDHWLLVRLDQPK